MRKSFFPAFCVLLASALACRGGENNLRRDEQRYEVVQEGAGGAVTSTLGGADAVPPLTPSMTGTNEDTTTAFTLPATTTTSVAVQPGTLAGTLPPAPREPAPARPPVEQPVVERQPPPPPVPVDPVPPPATATESEQRDEESEEEARPDEPPPPPPPPGEFSKGFTTETQRHGEISVYLSVSVSLW